MITYVKNLIYYYQRILIINLSMKQYYTITLSDKYWSLYNNSLIPRLDRGLDLLNIYLQIDKNRYLLLSEPAGLLASREKILAILDNKLLEYFKSKSLKLIQLKFQQTNKYQEFFNLINYDIINEYISNNNINDFFNLLEEYLHDGENNVPIYTNPILL